MSARIDYKQLAIDLARARAAEVLTEVERRHAETFFPCKGCGVRTQNTGDFPYHSYSCRFAPRPTQEADDEAMGKALEARICGGLHESQ